MPVLPNDSVLPAELARPEEPVPSAEPAPDGHASLKEPALWEDPTPLDEVAGSAQSPTPTTWTVVVSADRTYYDSLRAKRVIAGPPVPFPAHTSERRFPLAGKQMRIGRRSVTRDLEPEIDLAGPHADPGISRLHAVLIAAPDGTWGVLDPGSANGTLLNGREIGTGDLATLHDGDRINLGAWTAITVHRG
jgi:hypothetical protein